MKNKPINLFRIAFVFIAINLCANTAVWSKEKSFYFKTSDGVNLYVRTAGTGIPCLFIHGGPGLTSYIFEATPAAQLIEQSLHMIYFDQRGSGRSSSAPDSNYSMKRMEKDIEELRAFLKINKWSLIGHSFGGLIMTAYAKDYPERINSMVYVHCTTNMQLSLKSHIDNGTRLLRDIGDTIKMDTHLTSFNQMMRVHEELAKKGIEYKIMFKSQHEKDVEDSLIRSATPHFNQDFQRFIWGMQEYFIDYTPYTKNILCPVLIINGTKDYAVGPDSYKSWKFKNSKVLLYKGGHTSYQEEPKWFASAVLKFLLH